MPLILEYSSEEIILYAQPGVLLTNFIKEAVRYSIDMWKPVKIIFNNQTAKIIPYEFSDLIQNKMKEIKE